MSQSILVNQFVDYLEYHSIKCSVDISKLSEQGISLPMIINHPDFDENKFYQKITLLNEDFNEVELRIVQTSNTFDVYIL
jgi:hypothetical protein